MKRYKGKGMIDLLFWLGLVLIIVAWVPDYLPAEATDLQALAKAAASNEEAKASLVDALKSNPNPNRGELRQMRRHVDELLLVAASREVTGDPTLPAPSEQKARDAKIEAERAAQIEAKPWDDMTEEERSLFVVSKLNYLLLTLFMTAVLWLGFRAFRGAYRGY